MSEQKNIVMSSVHILDTISVMSKLKMSVLPAFILPVRVSPPAANEVKILSDHT